MNNCSEMSEKKVAKEDVKTIAKPEICSGACKVRTSGCTGNNQI